MNPLVIVVCGGRSYSDREKVESTLDALRRDLSFVAIAHGGATGADELAGNWARRNRVQEILFPAAWGSLGRYAGPVRNRIMLDVIKPQVLLAFPGGAGTRGTVKMARERGVAIIEVEDEE